jgi:hypothetical protein
MVCLKLDFKCKKLPNNLKVKLCAKLNRIFFRNRRLLLVHERGEKY